MKFLKSLLGIAAALLVLAPLGHAEVPQLKTQVAGWYRLMVGNAEVTALHDGAIDLDTKLLKNAPSSHVQMLLARAFAAGPKMQTAVNAYLINTGNKLVLIDTGAAKLFGPTLGKVQDHLKASGYDTSQVDAVLITHLHGDHIGGLIGADGKPVFPKAEIFVSQADHHYWLTEKTPARASEATKAFFKVAREAAAPYIAAGKWKTFKGNAELVPGIVAVPAPGHTPGHSGFLLESNRQKLLFWGDIVHNAAVQFAKPEVSIEFDVTPKQAIATRKKIFKQAATEELMVAGTHLPFPGIGRVRADKSNYSYVPIEFSPLR